GAGSYGHQIIIQRTGEGFVVPSRIGGCRKAGLLAAFCKDLRLRGHCRCRGVISATGMAPRLFIRAKLDGAQWSERDAQRAQSVTVRAANSSTRPGRMPR